MELSCRCLLLTQQRIRYEPIPAVAKKKCLNNEKRLFVGRLQVAKN